MSTRINVTVGDGDLLDRNAQQAAANRQARVLADQRATAEAEGVERRAADRTAASLDPRTGLPASAPSSASTINRIDQEPAANRREEEVSVGAYRFKLSVEISNTLLELSDNASFEIATAEGSQRVTVDYGGQNTTLPDVTLESGGPGPDFINRSIIFDSIDPVSPQTYTAVGREGAIVRGSLDNSAVYTIPAGGNSAYVVVYLNYGSANVRGQITENYEDTAVATDTQVIGECGVFAVGAEFTCRIGWAGNPGFVSYSRSPEATDPPIRLWTRFMRQVVRNYSLAVTDVFTRYRNECHVYYVTDSRFGAASSIKKVTQDVGILHERIKAINPPVGSVPQEVGYRGSDTDFVSWSGTYAQTDPPNQFFETRFGPEVFSRVLDSSGASITTITAGAAPSKVPKPRLDGLQFATPRETDLAYYLGGLYMLDPSDRLPQSAAWGPSFAIILLRDSLPDLQFDGSDPRARDYGYMESTYLGSKPRYYVSACVGSACSDTEVVWYRTRVRPATTSDYLTESNFRSFRGNTIKKAPLPPQTFLAFFTDWGRPRYCRALASQLGLTPPPGAF